MNLGWVDYSTEERNKIIHILRSLRTQTAVDELGIGTIRDAFSDLMFPGISTLHTRAKYFVLVPYLFYDARSENFKKPSDVRIWIEKQQDLLVKTLLDNSNTDTSGIIGGRLSLSGGSVKYKPSSNYWNGLRIWGIVRKSDLSLDEACRLTFEIAKKNKEVHLKQETENDAGDDKDNLNTNIGLFEPLIPKYLYRSEASVRLFKYESEFLIDHITTHPNTKYTFLSYLLRNGITEEKFEKIDATSLPDEYGKLVKQAQDVANFIYGAHLLYNVIYSDNKENIVKDFEDWIKNKYHPIDLDAVVKITHCSRSTGEFLKRFDRFIQDNNISSAKELLIQC